jgi:Alpha amylase, catalytic domain/Starch-binding module 26
MPDLVLHVRKPTGWADSVNIHYWNTRPSAASTPWPGAPMVAEVGDWFVYRLQGIEAANLLFTDGAGRQTPDLWRDREGWYRDGQWYDSPPDQPSASPAQATPISAAPEGESPPEAIAPRPGPAAPTSHGIGFPDFRDETIYFLITTRFYDGDSSNNFFCRDRIKFNAEGQPEDPHWRGDFKGLIDRLDYIRDLGFTAIWITPPVENRSGLDYHGYHPYDWTRIDPRLESPEATYQDLIDEAHARGIKIIQDVVINHSCQYGIRGIVHIDHLPIKYYVPQGASQGQQNYGPLQGQPRQLCLAEPRRHR